MLLIIAVERHMQERIFLAGVSVYKTSKIGIFELKTCSVPSSLQQAHLPCEIGK